MDRQEIRKHYSKFIDDFIMVTGFDGARLDNIWYQISEYFTHK